MFSIDFNFLNFVFIVILIPFLAVGDLGEGMMEFMKNSLQI